MKYKVLVVEDDEMIRQGMEDLLGLHEFKLSYAASYKEALLEIHARGYDLYIFDVRLPDGNGIELCRKLRTVTDNPVLFLTAFNEEVHVVEALNAGGDDYLAKPFRSMELLARVRALLRRSAKESVLAGYITGGMKLDIAKQAAFVEQEMIALTTTEYKLLHALIKRKGSILSRDMLMQEVWDYNDIYITDNTLSVHISRIRDKLTPIPGNDCIGTRQRVGYWWKMPVEEIRNQSCDVQDRYI